MPSNLITTQLFAHSGHTEERRANDLWRELEAAARNTHVILGWIGYDRLGNFMYLTRHVASGRLQGLRLAKAGTDGEGREQYRASTVETFDPSTLEFGSTCESCDAPLTGWEHECARCGAATPGATMELPISPEERLDAARAALPADYEVLGEIPRGPSAPVAYFARHISNGRLVAFALRAVHPGGPSSPPPKIQPLTPTPTSPHSGDLGPLGGKDAEGEDAGGKATAVPEPLRKVCPRCGTFYPSSAVYCTRDQRELVMEGQSEPLIGETIGGHRYKVLKRLGSGGMGRVYLAEHLIIGRQDAVKVMNPNLALDADAVKRFSREAQNACRIRHPNVAMVYDSGETGNGTYYIAMEYVEGQSLAELLKSTGQLPVPQALHIASQIADGLGAAHALEPPVVHRDLKPENIMLKAQGDGTQQAKIVDFGIAKATKGQSVTTTGGVIGTPAYMSPEQLSGKPVDQRADVYSLGCILYEMLVGERAYPEDNLEAISYRKLFESPPRPGLRRRDIPQVIDDAVAKALRSIPGERQPSIRDFRTALETAPRKVSGATPSGAMSSETTAAKGDESPVLPPRPEGRPFWMYLLAIGAAATVLVAIALLVARPDPKPPISLPAPASKPPPAAAGGPTQQTVPPVAPETAGQPETPSAPSAGPRPTVRPVAPSAGPRPSNQTAVPSAAPRPAEPTPEALAPWQEDLVVSRVHTERAEYQQALDLLRAASQRLTLISADFPKSLQIPALRTKLANSIDAALKACAAEAAVAKRRGETVHTCT